MASDNQIIFSIIIPAKDEEKFIIHCLQAMRYLDFNPDEMETIVVDNGSTDRTVALAKEYGAKVIVINSGTISKLRNEGAKIASGKILAFIDADCVPHKNWLPNAVPHFEDKNVACVGSEPLLPDENVTWVQKAWSTMKQKPVQSETHWLSSCNFIVRKDVFDAVGGFDESLITCEDADIGYRIYSKWKLVNDPSVSVVHLREPKTIPEFFKKEIWHGVGNYKGLLRHGLFIRELPSLIVPFWTILCCLGLCLGLIFVSFNFMVVSAALYFLLPAVLTTRVVLRTGEFLKGPSIFILFVIYSIARAIAVFKL